jgi:hypothetical protein
MIKLLHIKRIGSLTARRHTAAGTSKGNTMTTKTMKHGLDLDVDAPELVAQVLRNAAQSYHESSSELQSAWQDADVGKVWDALAKALETAAIRCEQAYNKYLG